MINFKDNKSLFFLGFVIFTYILLYFINKQKTYLAITKSLNIFNEIYYVFIIIFILIVFTNYIIKPEIISKYLGKKAGIKGWFISIITGVLSTGPIYMWYPLLKNLKKQGARDAYISTFLYNRSIKLPILPIIIFYFSLKFVVVLLIVMIVISVIQGIIVEKIVEVKKHENSNSV
jgi:uncharacterized membrane protein YraQ (UPF0718 family)